MSFLHKVSPAVLNILYKGEYFQPLSKYSLKYDDIGYFKNFENACEIATILAFHHALIEFVQKPEIEKISFFFRHYSPPVWNSLINYTFVDEDNLKRKEKSEIKKEWELICKRGFPYNKTPSNYTLVFGSLTTMPDDVNMINKLPKDKFKNHYNSREYYFELTKENIDVYLKFLLGEEHYKFYYVSTEHFLIKRNSESIISEESSTRIRKNRL